MTEDAQLSVHHTPAVVCSEPPKLHWCAPVAVVGAAACASRWRSPSFSLCSAELMAVSVASLPS